MHIFRITFVRALIKSDAKINFLSLKPKKDKKTVSEIAVRNIPPRI